MTKQTLGQDVVARLKRREFDHEGMIVNYIDSRTRSVRVDERDACTDDLLFLIQDLPSTGDIRADDLARNSIKSIVLKMKAKTAAMRANEEAEFSFTERAY